MEDRLAETLAYLDVRRVQDRYADIVTRRAWEELPEVLDADCPLELSLGDRSLRFVGPAEIGSFIATALEQFSFFEFAILNTVVEVDVERGRAAARMYMQELRQGVTDGRRTDAFGVYHDRLDRAPDGRWRFTHRRYGSYSRTAAPGADRDQDVFPLPEVPLAHLLE